MSTSVAEDEWGSATLYEGGRPIEPRTFTEADPLAAGILVPGWDALDDADEGRAGELPVRWSDTTYVGKPRRRADRKRVAGAPASDDSAPEDSAAATTALDTAAAPPDAADAAEVPADTGVPERSPADAERNDRRMLAASGSMAVASLVSRVTGFVRSILLVAALGQAAVGTAYNSGNNLPNMIYELLLGGVLSSVFIPLLVQAQARDDDDGLAYTQRLLSIATAALGVMTLLAVAAAPWIAVFAPAGPQRELTSVFATLLLPEIFFYGLGAMFMAVLNIRHVYKPGAWSPVLNNAIMIVTVAVFFALPGSSSLDPRTITTAQILVLGIGTSLGIAAQALVMIPALRRSGFRWQWRFRARPEEKGRMGEVGTLAGWVLAYVVISQIGVVVIQVVGNRNGGFSVFTYTDLLFQMPYGILVVSLLTAIMPRMSRAAVRGDDDAVKSDLSLAARLSAVALVPVTFGLIVLGTSLTVAVFSFRNESISDAHLIGSALAWSAFGLFPFAVVMLQLRVFYAMRDGRTPTLINAFMVGVKVVLVLVTNAVYAAPAGTNVNEHPSVRAVEWLNIATSVSYVVGAVVGHVVLTRRLGRLGFTSVARTVAQIAAASVLGAAAAYGVVRLARSLFGEARLGALSGLVGGAVVGLVVMGAVAWRLRIPDVVQLLANARRSRPRESAGT